jgi:type 1 glutamine amidotransferase
VRQLSYQGLNVVLMRDMTDTMYDPDKAPQVVHPQGTDLVVEHIEKYWCPSITSSDITGKPEFSFAEDKRPHVVFVVGEDEYQTDTTLPQFAAEELFPRGIRCTFVKAADDDLNRFPLMTDLETADLMFLSVRRRTPAKEELDVLRKYVKSGKPIVAIRTSSHAFALRDPNASLAANLDNWPTFDVDVLGGKYEGHYGKVGSGPSSFVWVNPEAKHPLAADLPIGELPSASWLYKYTNLAPDVKVLLWGLPVGVEERQPAAWVRGGDQKVFYTMLGHPNDFKQPAFRDLMRRAVLWGLEK